MAYAVIAPRTLPARPATAPAGSGSAPCPARKKANSIVESPGAGGKTYSSHANRATTRSPDSAWAAMAPWIASLIARSNLLDQVAQEGNGPAFAAQRLDDAHDRHGQVEQDQVDQPEGEQPGEYPRQGGENRADEDDAEEHQAGHAAQDQ